jgi:tRNA G18 (ribose-2'-O)-methylase SpoU
MPIEITDPADERVRDYFALTDVALRRKLEPERGLYLAESVKVIRRALTAGHRPRSFLMVERWLTDLADLVEGAEYGGVPVFVASATVIEAMTGFHLHRGALAAMHRPPLVAPTVLLQNAFRVLVLEDFVDHTNVGAVFRSAAALGVDAVLITPRCADPLYRRAVRVSMGTVFQVPWTRIDAWPGGLEVLRDNGFTVAAFALTDDATSLDDLAADPPERLAVIFGAEGDGLSRRAVEGADLVVRIPMAGGVDSLNVAAASAVAMWALRPHPPPPPGSRGRAPYGAGVLGKPQAV